MKKQIKEIKTPEYLFYEDEMPTILEIREMIFEAKQEGRKQALEEVEKMIDELIDEWVNKGKEKDLVNNQIYGSWLVLDKLKSKIKEMKG